MKNFKLACLIQDIHPDKLTSNIIYSEIGAESLRNDGASNNPLLSTAIKTLVTGMSRQGVFTEKLDSVILKFFKTNQEDLSNIYEINHGLLDLIS